MATAADIYAQAQSDALKKQLQNLYTNQENVYQGSLKSNDLAKQQLLDEITKQAGTVEKGYQTNANQAYISKVLGEKTLQSGLNRLGLAGSGYGVGKTVDVANTYGTNLKDLQTAKQTSLDTLNTNKTNTISAYDQKAADLASANYNAVNDITKYINEAGTTEYNNAYSRYLADLETQSNIAANNASISTIDNTGGVTGSGGTTISTPYYNGPINPDVQHGTFNTTDSNGIRYQPNNFGGVKVFKSGKSVKDIFGAGVIESSLGDSLDNQNVWKTAKGNYYIWDGSQNRYVNVTSQVKQASLKIPKKKKWN